MFNCEKPLPKDRAEMAKRVRASLFHEERKKRIFDPATRIIGIDKNALDNQVKEKRLLQDQEKAKNHAYSNKLLQDCETSLKLDEEQRKKQKQLDLEILEFRKKFQAPETRREFDINDPLKCKRGKNNDDNDRKNIATFFEGAVDTSREDKAEQVLQQRVWLEMQIRDKKMAQEENKNVERSWQETQHTIAQQALRLASLENECKKKLLEANHRYNQALAAEQNTNRKLAEVENAEDKMAEVYNAITGDLLTENLEQGFNNALCPGKISRSSFKGLTPAMKQAIYDEQAKQRVELKLRKEAYEKQEKDWSELISMLARCGTINDKEMQAKKKNLEDRIKDFNLNLAEEQKKEQEYLNNVFYKNMTSDEFFKQFNTTTR